MAVFESTASVKGRSLKEMINDGTIPAADWLAIKERVVQGGRHIIELRGRSSFQSPAYLSIEMMAAAMGGKPFRWPAGVYVNDSRFSHIMMAMETTIGKDGISYLPVDGTPQENQELERSYRHLCGLRDEVIRVGVLPAISDWHLLNPYIDENTDRV